MTTTTYYRKRRRNRPIPVLKRKKQGLISFQKENNAKVKFNSFPLSTSSKDRAVKCEITSILSPKKAFAWGTNFKEAFRNAAIKYNYGGLS